jgi:hypothetical protein
MACEPKLRNGDLFYSTSKQGTFCLFQGKAKGCSIVLEPCSTRVLIAPSCFLSSQRSDAEPSLVTTHDSRVAPAPRNRQGPRVPRSMCLHGCSWNLDGVSRRNLLLDCTRVRRGKKRVGRCPVRHRPSPVPQYTYTKTT